MSHPNCAATCTLPAQHDPACENPDTCGGCLPARAADGLHLCTHHADLLPQLALNMARIYGLLGERLIPTSGQGPRTGSRGAKTAPVPDDGVMQARADIRRSLVVLAQRIADERGVTPPLKRVVVRLTDGHEGPAKQVTLPTGHRLALGEFVAQHAEWLAAQPDAGHICDLLVYYGRIGGPAWRLAYPAHRDRLYLGLCPVAVTNEDDEPEPCGQRLYQQAGDYQVTCTGCGTAAHVDRWEKWLYPGAESAIVDAYSGARALSRTWYREVSPGQIRLWTFRNKVAPVTENDPTAPPPAEGKPWPQRRVRDGRGRTLYRLADLRAAATRAWGEPPKVRRSAA